ncbi:hypothetical protein Anas_12431 [Armadillidium nasatum]|uniref:Uncharacterized protein n=1 Tax=Armadillidium nasatum TaxID=96803 RepID=A0A5N5SY20_9CRUS|nr:hypothetical protein Anas_12431 [Armadillidium nasatum]
MDIMCCSRKQERIIYNKCCSRNREYCLKCRSVRENKKMPFIKEECPKFVYIWVPGEGKYCSKLIMYGFRRKRLLKVHNVWIPKGKDG